MPLQMRLLSTVSRPRWSHYSGDSQCRANKVDGETTSIWNPAEGRFDQCVGKRVKVMSPARLTETEC